jgi:ADP-ribose pyrophosphatase YjhB (NUDIX family)
MESSPTNIPDCFYRVSIKGLYVHDGKLLFVEEQDEHGVFTGLELPGGGLDFGETFEIGFRREVDEEMGLAVTSFSPLPVYVWTQQFPARPGREAFASLVLAHRVTFDSLNFTPSRECAGLQFLTPAELAEAPLKPQCEPLRQLFKLKDFTG